VMGAVAAAEQVDAEEAPGHGRTVELAPARGYGVARVRYALGDAGSFIGAMATAVTQLGGHAMLAHADHDAVVAAVDGAWQWADSTWQTVAQAAVSSRIGGPGYERGSDGSACTATDAATDPDCAPIARADGTLMGAGATGVGIQSHTVYQTKTRIMKIDFT